MFVYVSRLIPKPLSRARKNGLERGDHESRINKNLNHVSREKNSPDHVSRKKYRGPSLKEAYAAAEECRNLNDSQLTVKVYEICEEYRDKLKRLCLAHCAKGLLSYNFVTFA